MIPICHCPTCGAPLADAIRWEAETRTFRANGVAARFTKSEAKIFDAIWSYKRNGGIPDLSKLAQIVYSDDIDGGPEYLSSLSVLIMRIRKKLKGTGFNIPFNRSRPKLGFVIVREGAPAQ